MEKNVQLHHVVADITGVTGMKIVCAIVTGERNASNLASHRDHNCKQSVETIRDALSSHFQEEHVLR